MTAPLGPYPEYRDSGVEWLGKVPAHWEVRPNRAHCTTVAERGHPEERMLSVTIADGVIKQSVLLADSSKKDRSRLDKSEYKLVLPGDIAYNKMRAWQGAFGRSDERGIVSPAYVVVRPQARISSYYLHYLYRTPIFAREAQRWSYGIASDMWSLRPHDFSQIHVCRPPYAEQHSIIRFLDIRDRQVERYIAAKRRLIEMLEEEKQAVVSRAVTRGLDPSVATKPSGVAWLGDIPAHWDVYRAERRLSVQKQGVPPDTLGGQEVFHYSIPNVQEYGDGFVEPMTSIDSSKTRVDRPLLLVSKLNPRKRTIALAKPHPTLATLASSEFVALERQHCVLEFVLYFYLSAPVTEELSGRVQSATKSHQRCAPKDISKLPIAWPPLDEQRAIARHLDKATADLDAAVARTRRQIALMEEYRTRLIADVVTGQLDVREAPPP